MPIVPVRLDPLSYRRFNMFLRFARDARRLYPNVSLKGLRSGFRDWTYEDLTTAHLTYCANREENGCKTVSFRGRPGSTISSYANSCGVGKLLLCSVCNYCRDCCRCPKCTSCSRVMRPSNHRGYQEAACAGCGLCRRRSCCRCIRCAHCQTVVPDRGVLHSRCQLCTNCCRCDSEVEFFSPDKPTFHEAPKARRLKNRSTRFVGAEIEVSRIYGKAPEVGAVVRDWGGGIVTDGSLPGGGFEINTAPANGDVLLHQIDEICGVLASARAETNKSCGCHIHIDARDFNYYDIRRLIYFYDTVEPILFAMMPPERRSNSYCAPCGRRFLRAMSLGRLDYKAVKRSVSQVTYGNPDAVKNLKEYRASKNGGERYFAMNIHSWFYRGTIECRLLYGTTDPHVIKMWSRLWITLLDFVVASTDDQIRDLRCNNPWRNYEFTPQDAQVRWAALEAAIAKQPRLREFVVGQLHSWGPELINKALLRHIGSLESPAPELGPQPVQSELLGR